MRRSYKKSILLTIVIIGLLMLIPEAVLADDPVVDVTVDPEEPEVESTVSFSADITSDNTIEEVYLRIKECTDSICYPLKNVSMDGSGSIYSLDYNLEYSDATYFDYWLEIKTDDSWFKTDSARIYMKEKPDNNGNNGDTTVVEEDKDKSIPGFELLTLFIALIISLILCKRKRLR